MIFFGASMRLLFIPLVAATIGLYAASCWIAPRFRHVVVEAMAFADDDSKLISVVKQAHTSRISDHNFIRVSDFSKKTNQDFWHPEFANRAFRPNVYLEEDGRWIAYETDFAQDSPQRSFVCDPENGTCQLTPFDNLDFERRCVLRFKSVKPIWYIENEANPFQEDVLDSKSEFFRENWVFIDFSDVDQTIYMAKRYKAIGNLSRLEILNRNNGKRYEIDHPGRLEFQAAVDHQTFYFYCDRKGFLINLKTGVRVDVDSRLSDQPGVFSNNGDWFAVATNPTTIQIFDCRQMRPASKVEFEEEFAGSTRNKPMVQMCFANQSDRIAIAEIRPEGRIDFRDCKTGETVNNLNESHAVRVGVDWLLVCLFTIGFLVIGLIVAYLLPPAQNAQHGLAVGSRLLFLALGIGLITITNYLIFGGMSWSMAGRLTEWLGPIADTHSLGIWVIAALSMIGTVMVSASWRCFTSSKRLSELPPPSEAT